MFMCFFSFVLNRTGSENSNIFVESFYSVKIFVLILLLFLSFSLISFAKFKFFPLRSFWRSSIRGACEWIRQEF